MLASAGVGCVFELSTEPAFDPFVLAPLVVPFVPLILPFVGKRRTEVVPGGTTGIAGAGGATYAGASTTASTAGTSGTRIVTIRGCNRIDV